MNPQTIVIDTIIARIILYPGSTICEIAEDIGYAEDTVFAAINDLFDNPWNGIQLKYTGYRFFTGDLNSIDRRILYKHFKWEIRGKIILTSGALGEEDYILLDFIRSRFVKGKKSEKHEEEEPITIIALKQTEFPEDVNINLLGVCIRNLEWVKIGYQGPKEMLSLDLLPLRFVFHQETGQWYLLGLMQNKKTQLFRIQRIAKLEQTGKKEDKPVKNYLISQGPLEVKIKVYPNGNVLEAVRNTVLEEGVKAGDDSILFTLHIQDVNGFIRWIRGFGSSIEVISPKKIRNRIIASAKQTISNYKKLDEYIRKAKECD